MPKGKEKQKGAKTNSVSNAGLMSAALACIAAGTQLFEKSVNAGVFLVVVGVALPFVREYLKK